MLQHTFFSSSIAFFTSSCCPLSFMTISTLSSSTYSNCPTCPIFGLAESTGLNWPVRYKHRRHGDQQDQNNSGPGQGGYPQIDSNGWNIFSKQSVNLTETLTSSTTDESALFVISDLTEFLWVFTEQLL